MAPQILELISSGTPRSQFELKTAGELPPQGAINVEEFEPFDAATRRELRVEAERLAELHR